MITDTVCTCSLTVLCAERCGAASSTSAAMRKTSCQCTRNLCLRVLTCAVCSASAAYGQFFLQWYSGSLLEHGNKLMSAASRVFGSYQNPGGVVDSPLAHHAQALLQRIQSIINPAGAANSNTNSNSAGNSNPNSNPNAAFSGNLNPSNSNLNPSSGSDQSCRPYRLAGSPAGCVDGACDVSADVSSSASPRTAVSTGPDGCSEGLLEALSERLQAVTRCCDPFTLQQLTDITTSGSVASMQSCSDLLSLLANGAVPKPLLESWGSGLSSLAAAAAAATGGGSSSYDASSSELCLDGFSDMMSLASSATEHRTAPSSPQSRRFYRQGFSSSALADTLEGATGSAGRWVCSCVWHEPGYCCICE